MSFVPSFCLHGCILCYRSTKRSLEEFIINIISYSIDKDERVKVCIVMSLCTWLSTCSCQGTQFQDIHFYPNFLWLLPCPKYRIKGIKYPTYWDTSETLYLINYTIVQNGKDGKIISSSNVDHDNTNILMGTQTE